MCKANSKLSVVAFQRNGKKSKSKNNHRDSNECSDQSCTGNVKENCMQDHINKRIPTLLTIMLTEAQSGIENSWVKRKKAQNTQLNGERKKSTTGVYACACALACLLRVPVSLSLFMFYVMFIQTTKFSGFSLNRQITHFLCRHFFLFGPEIPANTEFPSYRYTHHSEHTQKRSNTNEWKRAKTTILFTFSILSSIILILL